LNDILASPGGTFQLANPVIANNTTSVGPFNFATLSASQVGGGNANGPFGAGSGTIFGQAVSFALTDATPGGGGSASYGIESWTSSFTEVGHYVGTFGTYLSIGGNLPIVGSSAVAALQTEVSFTLSANTTNYVLAPIILTMGRTAGGFTFVAIGGTGAPAGGGAAYTYLGGNYSMLGVDNYAANILNGTTIHVTSTLTFYADPASVDSITPSSSLISQIDGGLPGISFGGSAVPEPSSMVMGSTALAVLSVVGWMRRRSTREAA
jgi:hypothetical protein